jgi:hypothetical protein
MNMWAKDANRKAADVKASADAWRKLNVAVEAERHWWVQKLAAHIEGLRPMAGTTTNIGHWTQIEIDALDAIVRERTR